MGEINTVELNSNEVINTYYTDYTTAYHYFTCINTNNPILKQSYDSTNIIEIQHNLTNTKLQPISNITLGTTEYDNYISVTTSANGRTETDSSYTHHYAIL